MPLHEKLSPSDLLARARSDRWSQLIVVAFIAAAIAITLVGGGWALAILVVGVPIVASLARVAAGATDRAFLIRLMLLALAGRALLAAALHVVLVARGSALGAMFQDDAGYAVTAGALAKTWQGLPISTYEFGLLYDPSVANGYVALAAGVLRLTAGSILALKLVNAIFGVVHVALVYRIMRNLGLPGARLGALAMAVFPTLVLWSVLTLKDATSLTLMLAVFWSISEVQRGARWWPWPITVIALILLRDIRLYLFAILVVAWPLGLFIASRRRAALGAFAISAVLLLSSADAVRLFAPDIFDLATNTRGWMAAGARSAFVEPPPIAAATPGQEYEVAVPGHTKDPALPARRFEVSSGTELITDCSSTPQPVIGQTARPVLCVRPGDVIVIGKAAGTPRPPDPSVSPTPVPELAVRPDFVNVVSTAPPAPTGNDESITFEAGLVANLVHLPIGVAFLVGAPFPLTARSGLEIALAPDTLLWYLTVVLAVVGLVQLLRRRDLRFAVGVLAMGAIALVLSLTEGNVGTLVRHRAMLVPLAVMAASTGAVFTPAITRRLEAFRSRFAVRARST